MWLIVFIGVIAIAGAFLQVKHNSKKETSRISSLKSKLSSIKGFNSTKLIEGFGGHYLFAVDESSKKVGVFTTSGTRIVNFSDIIGVETIEDGTTVSKKSKARIVSGAIVGGVLAGGVGAVVGGLSGDSKHKTKVSTLNVKILLRDINTPAIYIPCFDSKTMTTERKSSLETEGKVESYKYKLCKTNADKIKDTISVIIDRSN